LVDEEEKPGFTDDNSQWLKPKQFNEEDFFDLDEMVWFQEKNCKLY